MSEIPMVEAVARAICKAEGIDPDRCDEALSARGGSPQWRYEIGAARAAIRAMRAAPEAVLGAIHDRVRIECRPGERTAYILNADEMWAAGIDAALAVPEKGREP